MAEINLNMTITNKQYILNCLIDKFKLYTISTICWRTVVFSSTTFELLRAILPLQLVRPVESTAYGRRHSATSAVSVELTRNFIDPSHSDKTATEAVSLIYTSTRICLPLFREVTDRFARSVFFMRNCIYLSLLRRGATITIFVLLIVICIRLSLFDDIDKTLTA